MMKNFAFTIFFIFTISNLIADDGYFEATISFDTNYYKDKKLKRFIQTIQSPYTIGWSASDCRYNPKSVNDHSIQLGKVDLEIDVEYYNTQLSVCKLKFKEFTLDFYKGVTTVETP